MKALFFLMLILIAPRMYGQCSKQFYSTKKKSLSQREYLNNKSYWGFTLLMSSPLSGLSRQGYRSGGGISTEYYSQNLIYKKSKMVGLRLGGSYFFTGQGGVKNNVLLHDPYQVPGTQTLTNTHSAIDFHSMILSEKGRVRPYADFFIGYSFFSSHQELKITNPVAGYQTDTYSSHRYTAMDYGSSLGAFIKLSDGCYINLKASVSGFSNKINYMDLNHLNYDGFMYVPTYLSAKPSMCSFQAGLIFKLNQQSSNPYSKTSRGSSRGNYYHRSNYRSGNYFFGGGGGGIPLK